MNGTGITNESLKKLWGNNMLLKPDNRKILKENLQITLDAEEGQYDKFIDNAIEKSIIFCKRLLPISFGEYLETELKLQIGKAWYEANTTHINDIKEVYLKSLNKHKLHALKTFDFLNLPQNLGMPNLYTKFNGKIGVNPIPCADNFTLIIRYIGYDDAYLLKETSDLIYSRALYILHKDITGDKTAAQQSLQDFNEHIVSYNINMSKQNCSGYITPTLF